jgi:hypothetical protein
MTNPDPSDMSQEELDLWSDINNPKIPRTWMIGRMLTIQTMTATLVTRREVNEERT